MSKNIGKIIDLAVAPDVLLNKTGASPYENPDKVLGSKGISYIEAEVERDPHVYSLFNTRIGSLVKRGFEIRPVVIAGKVHPKAIEAAEFVNFALKNMESDFVTDLVGMMSALSRGYSLSEINYKIIEFGKFKGKLGLKNIRLKDQSYFAFKFDKYGYYTPIQLDPVEKALPPEKFIHFINGLNDENPYGTPLSSLAAFYVWLKKNSFKFWAVYNDHFASPTPKVEVPENSKVGDKADKAADEIINAIEQGRGLKVPRNIVVGFLEATRNGQSSYDGFIDRCNKEISKLILGQTLTSEDGKGKGSHALGSVHADVLQTYTLYDLIVSSAVINQQLIKRLVAFNYDLEHCPEFRWNNTASAALISQSQAFEGLLRCGLEIPKSYLYQVTGIPIPQGNEPILELKEQTKQTAKGIDNKVKKHSQNGVLKFSQSHKKQIKKNEDVIKQATNFLVKPYEQVKQDLIKHKKLKITRKKFSKKLQKHIFDFLLFAHLHGITSVEQVSNYNHYQALDKIISDYLARKILTKAEFKELSNKLKKEAFTVAFNESESIEEIKTELLPLLKGEITIKDFQTKINNYFDKNGLSQLKPWHLETVVRNNLQSQYNKGRQEVFNKVDKSDFPQRQVSVIVDNSTRPSHKKLNGFTADFDDPIWGVLIPPFDHNCRCQIRLVHESEELENSKTSPDLKNLGFIN